jgi:hypothetical protein
MRSKLASEEGSKGRVVLLPEEKRFLSARNISGVFD